MVKLLKEISPAERKNLISYFRTMEPSVIMASLIGSYGTDYQRSDSDIDFAVLFEKKISLLEEMRILKDLSAILNYEDVDLVNLNNAPITLQFRAIEGDILYEKNSRQVSDFMEMVFKIYGDYSPVLRNLEREMLKGGSGVAEC